MADQKRKELDDWAVAAMDSFSRQPEVAVAKVDLTLGHVRSVIANCSGVLSQANTGKFLLEVTKSRAAPKDFSSHLTVFMAAPKLIRARRWMIFLFLTPYGRYH
jgi:hypothetical protein